MSYIHPIPIYAQSITRTVLPIFVPVRNPARGEAEYLFQSASKHVDTSDVKKMFEYVTQAALCFACNPMEPKTGELMLDAFDRLILRNAIQESSGITASLFLEHARFWSTPSTRKVIQIDDRIELEFVCYHNVLCACMHLILKCGTEKVAKCSDKIREISLKCATLLMNVKSVSLKELLRGSQMDKIYMELCSLYATAWSAFRTSPNPWLHCKKEMTEAMKKATMLTVQWDEMVKSPKSAADMYSCILSMPLMAFLHDFQACIYMTGISEFGMIQLNAFAAAQASDDETQKGKLLDFLLGLREYIAARMKTLSVNGVIERCTTPAGFRERQTKFADGLHRVYCMPQVPDELMEVKYGSFMIPNHIIEGAMSVSGKPDFRLDYMITHFQNFVDWIRLPKDYMRLCVQNFQDILARLEGLTSENFVTPEAAQYAKHMGKYIFPAPDAAQ